MRGRSLFLVGIVLLLAMLASGERAHITEEMPDTIERLIGNSYLHHFISTKSSIDINKFSVGSKTRQASNDLTPVVIIPSLIGSKLRIKLENRYSHWYCDSNSDWYTLWVPSFKTTFLPYIATCWLDNISLNYNMTTHWGDLPQGVKMRFADYGGVGDVDYLDDSNQVGIWNDTIALLVKAGYTIGKNLRAAPYDWRVSPAQYQSDFKALKQLIERTYDMNGNRSVALASLSMGGSYTILFLNTFVSQAWKDKYIHSWTSFCSPFGGSPIAVAALASSFNKFGMPWYILSSSQMLSMTQSFGSIYWLIPFEQLYNDMIIAITPTQNYTSADFEQLFQRLGNAQGADMYSHMQFARTMQAPGVAMNCIHGWNISTPHQVLYTSSDLYSSDATFITGDGDGTVPIKGLSICDKWQQDQKQPITTYPIANMEHGSDVKNPIAMKIFLSSLGIESVYDEK
jgi:hypothetical protein